MRCIFPFDNVLCPLENACVHSYDSYDSTTDCLPPCLPNEMYFSTRQYSLSTRLIGPQLLANEMHFSTRTPSYTTRHNIVHIPNQMHFFKVNSQTTSCNNTAGNYLISVAKLTIKTIDYENVPLERVE